MPGRTILLIRHAEKPRPGRRGGFDVRGRPDDHSLTAQGWQRAGAWAELFAPSLPGVAGGFPRPTAVFASARTGAEGPVGSKSRRPVETAQPLADKLGLTLDCRFAEGQEAALAEAALQAAGTVLICWQHERLPDIARRISADRPVPAAWPDDRFNPVLVFRREDGDAVWAFTQIAPLMLPGDRPDPL